MDEIIDRRFERVEKALATLITSISTYNPSPAFANDLVAADAELNQGLEQCKHSPPLFSLLLLTLPCSINPSIKLLQDSLTPRNILCPRHPNPRNDHPPHHHPSRTNHNPLNHLPHHHKPSLLLRAPLLRPPNQQIHAPSPHTQAQTTASQRRSRDRECYAQGQQIRDANKWHIYSRHGPKRCGERHPTNTDTD
jgi:hypothetical protein